MCLELLDLLNEVMQVLRRGRDHRQRDIGTFTDATNNMIGRDACDARIAHRFGSRRVSVASECDRLGEAFPFGQNMNNGFIAGWRDAI